MGYKITINSKTIFLVLLGLYVFIYTLHSSLLDVEIIFKSLTVLISLSLFVLFLSQNKIKLKYLIICVILFSLFLIAAIVTDRSYLVVFAAFIICASFSDFECIVKVSFTMSILAVLIIFIQSQKGVIEDRLNYGTRGISHSYGFSYYSGMAYILFYCIIMYLYMRKEKIKWLEMVIIAVLNYILYENFRVRLTCYLIWIILIMEICIIKFNIFNINGKWIRRIFRIAFIAGEGISILVMILYDNSNRIWLMLDHLFSGRLSLNQMALKLYQIRWFGNFIITQTGTVDDNKLKIGYFYIDSGFIYSLFGYGILFTLVVILMYSFLYDYACDSNNRVLFIWLTSVFIFTMVNNTWITLTYNPVLLYVPIIIKEKRIKKENVFQGASDQCQV